MKQARRAARRMHPQAVATAGESSRPSARQQASPARQPAAPAAERPLVTPENAMLLQQALGNRALGRVIAIQRDPPDAGAGAGSEAGGIAETPRQLLDRALSEKSSSAIAAASDFAIASDAEKLSLINLLLGFAPALGSTDAASVRRVWQAWGTELPMKAVEQSALWERCNVAGAALPASWLGGGAGSKTVEVSEQVGGTVYGVTGAYDYRIMADKIVITVNMNFNPDDGVSVPTGTWFGYITSTWNKFDAVNNTDPTQKKAIEFKPTAGSGHAIQVSAGTGRANAAHYYVADDRAAQSIPHEFGHLIGLEDEYERDAADYAKVTEGAVPAGSGDVATATTIATGIHDGLMLSEEVFEWHSTAVKRRQAAVEAVLAANHIVADYQRGQTPLTHEVSAQYVQLYGHEMSIDIMDRIDFRFEKWHDEEYQTWREQVLGTFQYTNTSLMGDMSDHAHPVAPRHVRAFAQIVQTFLQHGDWQPKER